MTFTKENWKEMQARRKPKPVPSSTGKREEVVVSPLSAPPLASPDWWKMPLDAAERSLKALREEVERVSQIIGVRQSQAPRKVWHCATCGTEVLDGQWFFKDDSRRDPKTGLVDPAVICRVTPSVCYGRYWTSRPRLGPRR